MPHRGQWWVHAWLRRILRVDVDAEFEVQRSGLWWRLNPSNYVESELFWLGRRDIWQLRHARKFLTPGCVILDIGANFGYYACQLATSLDKNCVIYAFEPVPSNHERLLKNIALNRLEGCIRPVKFGLSDSDGSASMTINPANTGAAHITGKAGDIPLTTLDHFCASEGIARVDFIKIDVEGFEVSVLRGGEETIKSSRPVILIELNPTTLRRVGLSARDVVDMLKGFGYSLYVARRERLEALVDLPTDDYVDVFCLPSNDSRKPPL